MKTYPNPSKSEGLCNVNMVNNSLLNGLIRLSALVSRNDLRNSFLLISYLARLLSWEKLIQEYQHVLLQINDSYFLKVKNILQEKEFLYYSPLF